ncbi:MAG: class I SAM-dependent methyltransferase [Candidatus Saccharibacteria bacterium]|nr:MAG: class I SAM-dependent methyltransferase [Candidatus Saccharibacteria bacterium]
MAEIAFWIFAAIVLAFGFVVFWGAPYVPSKRKELKAAFSELYPLKKDDVVIDIGSGDGVVLREAASHGAKAIGYELNPILVAITRFISRRNPNIQAHVANFWNIRLPEETTVIYLFAVSRDIGKLGDKIAEEATRLDKKLTVITYGSQMPGRNPLRMLGAHSLYEFTPLQVGKA